MLGLLQSSLKEADIHFVLLYFCDVPVSMSREIACSQSLYTCSVQGNAKSGQGAVVRFGQFSVSIVCRHSLPCAVLVKVAALVQSHLGTSYAAASLSLAHGDTNTNTNTLSVKVAALA